MRTFEEINTDIVRAVGHRDIAAIWPLAEEMLAIDTRESLMTANMALGTVNAMTRDFAAAMEHYDRALAVATELGDTANIAIITLNMGTVLVDKEDHDQAIEYTQRALAMSIDIGPKAKRGAAAAYRQLAAINQATGDFGQALEYYQRALSEFDELGIRPAMTSVFVGIGNIYAQTGDLARALDYHQRAKMLAEELGDHLQSAFADSNIGLVHFRMGEYDQALRYMQRSSVTFEQFADVRSVIYALTNIGQIYKDMGDLDKALEFFERALTRSVEENLHQPTASVLGSMVDVWLKKGELDTVEQILQRQAEMGVRDPALQTLHHAHRGMLFEARHDLEHALREYTEGLHIALNAGLRFTAAEIHFSLRDLAQKRNDFAGYIEHNNEYSRITEEIRGKEATQKLAIMESERKMEAELRERDKERALLYGALPESVATRMLRGEDVSGDQYDSVSVLFLDIAGFTTISDRIPPGHVVHLLKTIFTLCDDVCKRHGVTKIKTIGDSYMAVSFPNTENLKPKTSLTTTHLEHVVSAAQCAVDMLTALDALEVTMPPELGDTSWTREIGDIQVRIGIHCGPVTAGVIGTERLQYDVWGDTVNVASRMESHGEPGRVHVSEAFATALQSVDGGRWTVDDPSPHPPIPLSLRKRGVTEVKGKGPMTTYWLEGAA